MTMDRNEILKQLNDIFIEVLDHEEIVISESTTAADVEEWDSLMHIVLVVAVEKEFNIRLNASEVGKLGNVGEMIRLIERYAE